MQVIQVYQAHQWHKNGDHPDDYASPEQHLEKGEMLERSGAWLKEHEWEGQVVRYFRRPDVEGDGVCLKCGKTNDEHGWIDPAKNKGIEAVVCPGDWIMHSELGIYVAVSDVHFRRGYVEFPPPMVLSPGIPLKSSGPTRE